jgi:hypothetical protein
MFSRHHTVGMADSYSQQKAPILALITEDGGLSDISFGNPAVRTRGPMGFASPGCPGFALIGKQLYEIVCENI